MNSNVGTVELIRQLQAIGFKVKVYHDEYVSFEMIVPHGKFRGREIEVALHAPQFPLVPPSGPHVKPFLLPINPSTQNHPYGGIHDRKKPTVAFQYWSRPFSGWNLTKMDVVEYLGFLRTLFDFE